MRRVAVRVHFRGSARCSEGSVRGFVGVTRRHEEHPAGAVARGTDADRKSRHGCHRGGVLSTRPRITPSDVGSVTRRPSQGPRRFASTSVSRCERRQPELCARREGRQSGRAPSGPRLRRLVDRGQVSVDGRGDDRAVPRRRARSPADRCGPGKDDVGDGLAIARDLHAGERFFRMAGVARREPVGARIEVVEAELSGGVRQGPSLRPNFAAREQRNPRRPPLTRSVAHSTFALAIGFDCPSTTRPDADTPRESVRDAIPSSSRPDARGRLRPARARIPPRWLRCRPGRRPSTKMAKFRPSRSARRTRQGTLGHAGAADGEISSRPSPYPRSSRAARARSPHRWRPPR